MIIKQALQQSVEELKKHKIQEPALKARILLAFVINKDKEYLVVHEDEELIHDAETAFMQAIDRLLKGEPLQHITGVQEFMKLKFMVNKDVLIPRPDTEMLVEEIIKIVKSVGAASYAAPQNFNTTAKAGFFNEE